jgi:hypothetical protein
MRGLVPGIHVFSLLPSNKTWMAGTSPAMTNLYRRHCEERSDEAIQLSSRKAGLLRVARNDDQ